MGASQESLGAKCREFKVIILASIACLLFASMAGGVYLGINRLQRNFGERQWPYYEYGCSGRSPEANFNKLVHAGSVEQITACIHAIADSSRHYRQMEKPDLVVLPMLQKVLDRADSQWASVSPPKSLNYSIGVNSRYDKSLCDATIAECIRGIVFIILTVYAEPSRRFDFDALMGFMERNKPSVSDKSYAVWVDSVRYMEEISDSRDGP